MCWWRSSPMRRETLVARLAASIRAQRAVSSSSVMVMFLIPRFLCYTRIVSRWVDLKGVSRCTHEDLDQPVEQAADRGWAGQHRQVIGRLADHQPAQPLGLIGDLVVGPAEPQIAASLRRPAADHGCVSLEKC